jgi:hypothetical protein
MIICAYVVLRILLLFWCALCVTVILACIAVMSLRLMILCRHEHEYVRYVSYICAYMRLLPIYVCTYHVHGLRMMSIICLYVPMWV